MYADKDETPSCGAADFLHDSARIFSKNTWQGTAHSQPSASRRYKRLNCTSFVWWNINKWQTTTGWWSTTSDLYLWNIPFKSWHKTIWFGGRKQSVAVPKTQFFKSGNPKMPIIFRFITYVYGDLIQNTKELAGSLHVKIKKKNLNL